MRNGSFEELTFSPDSAPYPCPTSQGQMYKVEHWDKAYGSADYFNSCSNIDFPEFGTPVNYFGNQPTHFGDAYSLLACYSQTLLDEKEFIVSPLIMPLQAGKVYHLQFFISLSDNSNFAITNIGAYFSPITTRYLPRDDFFEFEPQVEHDSVAPLTDKVGWFKISGAFEADGGERFLTIGCFRRDNEDSIQQVSSNIGWDVSGYYIDDVSLVDLGFVGIGGELMPLIEVYPNPANTQVQLNFTGNQKPNVIRIHSIDGRILKTLSWQRNIKVTDLPSGIYLLQVEFEKGAVGVKRLVVQR